MKVTTLLQQKLEFLTRKDLSKKPRIFYKLKMCDEVLFSIYTLKQKMSFIASVNKKILSFIAQLSLFLRQTLFLKFLTLMNLFYVKFWKPLQKTIHENNFKTTLFGNTGDAVVIKHHIGEKLFSSSLRKIFVTFNRL